jgi:hypothetical protein
VISPWVYPGSEYTNPFRVHEPQAVQIPTCWINPLVSSWLWEGEREPVLAGFKRRDTDLNPWRGIGKPS